MMRNFSLKKTNLLILITTILININICDLPVNCKREQIEGEWTFRINKEKFNPDLKDHRTSCGHGFPDKVEITVGDINFSFEDYEDIKIKLGSDYKVYEIGSDIPVGNWTPVYDEGFILYYREQVFTAFMKYYLKENTQMKNPSKNLYASNCKKTMIGWFIENKAFNNKNWSCFFGFKTFLENEFSKQQNFLKPNKTFDKFDYKQSKNQEINNNISSKIPKKINEKDSSDNDDIEINSFLEIRSRNKSRMKFKTWMKKYEEQKDIVKEINENNLSWKAEVNEEFKGLSFMQLKEKIGMRKDKFKSEDNFSDVFDDFSNLDINNFDKDKNKNLDSSIISAIDNLDFDINEDFKSSKENNSKKDLKKKVEDISFDDLDFELNEKQNNNHNKKKENFLYNPFNGN